MQYNSFTYLLYFLPAVVVLYYVLPVRHRWWAILAASLAFDLLASRYLVIDALLAAGICWGAGLAMEHYNQWFREHRAEWEKAERKEKKAMVQRKKRRIMTAGILGCLAMLIAAKYLNFLVGNIFALLAFTGAQAPVFRLLMPLGISFYTMSAISYLADVYLGSVPAEHNYARLLTFLIFFPSLTEGPICRYGELGAQLREDHPLVPQNLVFGCQRIVWGLWKKIVLADRLDSLVGSIFDNPSGYSQKALIFGVLLYTFQLYMDFSGCIDITIGSAELFGLKIPENFRRPFRSETVNEFWQRWHMTLGGWLRDYVFYPLSLSALMRRCGKAARKVFPTYYAAAVPSLLALFVVWFTIGLWHGADWKYVLYGLYYYAIMTAGTLLEPLTQKLLGILHLSREMRGYRWFRIIRTFVFVNIGMMIFRADTLACAGEMLRRMAGLSWDVNVMGLRDLVLHGGLHDIEWLILLLGLILAILVGFLQERGIQIRGKMAAWPLPLQYIFWLIAISAVIVLGAYGTSFGKVDFIYAQF